MPIFYCSAYGNTRKLAQAIQTGIQSVLPEAVVKIYDLNDYDSAFLAQQLNGSDGFAIGSPTINGDAVPPIWELLSHVDAINNKKKPALVFGSYGWSGEAVPNITARLQGLKLAVFDPSCKVVFVPSEQNLAQASELGRQFAQQWVTA